jgi:hypothetical protein
MGRPGPGPIGPEANFRGHGSTHFQKGYWPRWPDGYLGPTQILALVIFLIIFIYGTFSKIYIVLVQKGYDLASSLQRQIDSIKRVGRTKHASW